MDNNNKIKNWYAYISGSPFDCESYFLVTVKPHFSIGTKISAIYAISNGPQPEELSTEMKTHIANALVTGTPQPNGSSSPVVLLKH